MSIAYVYKVCVIGNASVGKTSTIIRWAKGWFRQDYLLTVGVQHYAKIFDIDHQGESVSIKLILWDFAGQDMFKEVRAKFYDGAKGLVLMCDITRKETFHALPKWLQEASENIGQEVPLVLVSNKADLPDKEVSVTEIKRYAKSLDAPCVISSAKTGSNVQDVFRLIGKRVHERRMNHTTSRHDTFR
ncbi:MAG: hypothetical protein BAJATHORv1_30230 [Candidatus Thorarchaeota archaeon]|nr:MAG: hypothetical protein BAJATHORv1_30230 [Candidatus Thorarchaeota archaeon]